MRVISGERRGLKLFTLEGVNTRPTLDRVKETMFNVINFDIVDKNCLDVFSGSGNLSIEALSRGASISYLIENNSDAFSIIEKNIKKANYENKVKLFKKDFKVALSEIKKQNIKFSIIFLDPPYESDYYTEVLDLLVEYELLNDDAIIISEHIKNHIHNHEKFSVYKTKTFSKNALSFLKLDC